MSGHSKWASIKHKKGAADAKRGQIFTKIIKEIIVAARMGGGDEESNARLRTAILKAKGANMPKENIQRAIKKGTGELEGVEYIELNYEGYGPGGAAIMVEALTDNKNRTAADVRSIFTKSNGNLGENGCVSYMFKRKGVITFDASKYQEDALFEASLEAGAEDMENAGDVFEIMCEPEDFETVLNTLSAAGFESDSAEIAKVPDSTITLDNETTQKVLNLIERLEDNDDIQSVATNLDIPDDFVPAD